MTQTNFLTPERNGFDAVVKLLNVEMLDDVLEERNAKNFCANLRCSKKIKSGATPLMEIMQKLKLKETEVKPSDGIKITHCCSD